jgi:hypothetical protein
MKGLLAIVVLAGCFPAAPEPVLPPPVPTPDQCPDGFGPLGDLPGCYHELGALPWDPAEHGCEGFSANGREAHLVVIDRVDEHEAISRRSAMGDIWIGKLQQDRDDPFRNINYIVWGQSYFGAGEPNDYGGADERCVEYKPETGLWNDENCLRSDHVICEWDDVAPYDWHPNG